MKYLNQIGIKARKAFINLNKIKESKINSSLATFNKLLLSNNNLIIRENNKDVKNVKRKHLVDRLILNKKRIEGIRHSINEIIKFKSPVGQVLSKWSRPNGLKIRKVVTPIGVIGVIYESRPNVTADVAALSIKSGNCAILRGGSESLISNNYLAQLILESLEVASLPLSSIQIIETKDRAAVTELIQLKDYVDVIIPRGGKSLVKKITEESTIPVIKHLDGNCHMFVDDDANIKMALELVDNAKTQRLGTCNTLESLVVSSSIAKDFLPKILAIFDSKNIEMRVCQNSLEIIPTAKKANDNDFYEEYLGPIISCIIVKNIDDAIEHINHFSSGHTESIVTNNHTHAMKFLREVDSSSVMINTSTRFADGFEYGLGAEIGISTDKFHARGPVGLEGLTSMKYIVLGNGQTRK